MLRYVLLWAAFVVLFVGAIWTLELLEGNKITTTEYYGLRNLGGSFIYYFFLAAVFVYPIALMPLAFILNRLVRYWWLRVPLYAGIGAFAGLRIFRMLYNDSFVAQYELRTGSAVIAFGLLGLLYGALDLLIARQGTRPA